MEVDSRTVLTSVGGSDEIRHRKPCKFFVSHLKDPQQDTWLKMELIKNQGRKSQKGAQWAQVECEGERVCFSSPGAF
jgi:hypothetical protein